MLGMKGKNLVHGGCPNALFDLLDRFVTAAHFVLVFFASLTAVTACSLLATSSCFLISPAFGKSEEAVNLPLLGIVHNGWRFVSTECTPGRALDLPPSERSIKTSLKQKPWSVAFFLAQSFS